MIRAFMSPPTGMVVQVPIDHAFALSPVPQALISATWHVTHANAAWQALTTAVVGVSWFEVVHPADLARDLPLIGRFQSGELAAYRAQVRLHAQAGGWTEAELVVTSLPSGVAAGAESVQASALVTILPSSPLVLPPLPVAIAPAGDLPVLIAALAHDVHQHARLISAYGSLLARSDLTPGQQGHLTVITTQAERLQVVLSALVRWLRLADQPIAIQPCALADLWRSATADLAAEITTGDMPVVAGDPVLLGELVRALALNAVQYHPGRVRLVCQAIQTSGGWVLQISDDGPGIPESQRLAVLRPLHRLHTWEQVPGLGMGLAFASRIAARHGGGLELTATPSGGCMVQVSLPG